MPESVHWTLLAFFFTVAMVIALFIANFSHLHYNKIQRGYKAISGRHYKIARNLLTFTLDYIIMQIRKIAAKRAIAFTRLADYLGEQAYLHAHDCIYMYCTFFEHSCQLKRSLML